MGQIIDTSQECTTRIILEKSLQQTKVDLFINELYSSSQVLRPHQYWSSSGSRKRTSQKWWVKNSILRNYLKRNQWARNKQWKMTQEFDIWRPVWNVWAWPTETHNKTNIIPPRYVRYIFYIRKSHEMIQAKPIYCCKIE